MLNTKILFGLSRFFKYKKTNEEYQNNPEFVIPKEECTNFDNWDIIDYVENVYNMDKTGLFFRMVPNYTLLIPGEDIATAQGKKVQKDRVTLSVCCNATGSHKIPIHMIGKAAIPACIVG